MRSGRSHGKSTGRRKLRSGGALVHSLQGMVGSRAFAGPDSHAAQTQVDQTVRPDVVAYGYFLCGFDAFHRLGSFNSARLQDLTDDVNFKIFVGTRALAGAAALAMPFIAPLQD